LATILKWWKNYAAIVMLLVMVIGLKYPMIMLVFFICMIGPSLTGFFTGRFWCGNICPIGIFFDNVLIKISNHQKAPKFFKSKWIRIIFTTLMMSMFSFEIFYSFGKPVMMGMVFYEMILEAVIPALFYLLFTITEYGVTSVPWGVPELLLLILVTGKRS